MHALRDGMVGSNYVSDLLDKDHLVTGPEGNSEFDSRETKVTVPQETSH